MPARRCFDACHAILNDKLITNLFNYNRGVLVPVELAHPLDFCRIGSRSRDWRCKAGNVNVGLSHYHRGKSTPIQYGRHREAKPHVVWLRASKQNELNRQERQGAKKDHRLFRHSGPTSHTWRPCRFPIARCSKSVTPRSLIQKRPPRALPSAPKRSPPVCRLPRAT